MYVFSFTAEYELMNNEILNEMDKNQVNEKRKEKLVKLCIICQKDKRTEKTPSTVLMVEIE